VTEDYCDGETKGVRTGVSVLTSRIVVTKQLVLRTGVVLAVIAVVAAITLTLLRPDPAAPVYRPALATRVPGAGVPSAAGPVLPPAGVDSRSPAAAALAKALKPMISAPALGDGVSVDVMDPSTGEHLLSQGARTARTPASTAKLLTSAAALTALGPSTTVPTTVVATPFDSRVYLVGGGDVLLAAGRGDPHRVVGRAGLGDLAEQTADALRAQGRTAVQVILDDRYFSGPTRAPNWEASDVDGGYVAPVQALEIDAGRIGPGHNGQRSDDPAMVAAEIFVTQLRKHGITVAAAVQRGAAPPPPATGADPASAPFVVGQVRSAPISGLVEYALTESDNTVAEALGHLVAAEAGKPAGFAQAGPAVIAQLRSLGVPVEDTVLTDSSGLGDGSRVPARTLTAVLALATGDAEPQLRPILSGMPVAAVSGTLTDRFSAKNQKAATGVVRAKTGTLTGVSSLAGTLVDRDGRLLVFAAMADRVKSTLPARSALDRLVTTLANCGCSK
jgi:serine-type D-Ala-D-Ala carboxypeptidase/endopeptidase (penicillin-binding protein 4)